MKYLIFLSLFASCAHNNQGRFIASEASNEEVRLRVVSHHISASNDTAISLKRPLTEFMLSAKRNGYERNSSIEQAKKEKSTAALVDDSIVKFKSEIKIQRAFCKAENCVVLKQKITEKVEFDNTINIEDYKQKLIPVVFKKVETKVKLESPESLEDQAQSVKLLESTHKVAITTAELIRIKEKAKKNPVQTVRPEIDR